MGIIRVPILNVVLAAIYLGSGLSALAAPVEVREAFTAWGYPDWFRMAVGFVQATAGGCLVIPRAVPVAAAVLGATMVGAIATHLRVAEYPYALIPLGMLAALAFTGIRAWRGRPGA
jgi:putative oxidoreductase